MEGRIGAKIGILAVAMLVPVSVFQLVKLIQVFQFTNNLLAILNILLLLGVLFLLGLMTLGDIRGLRKHEEMEEWYKNSGPSAIIIGFFISFPIVADYIFRGVYQLGDAITTILVCLCSFLLIISGIITIHEVKERTGKVDLEK